MKKKDPKVDEFLRKAQKWRKELEALRKILLDSPLTEELKWGKPCYTFQKHNLIILQGFKDFCALMFFQGALLKDRKGILEKPGENSRAARRIPFTSIQEINKIEPLLKAYIREAIEVEEAGLKVDFAEDRDLDFPEEFQDKLDENPFLRTAFEALTPGRQRAYLLYFTGAKQSTTRTSRIEKCRQQILDGRGLNDR